MTTFYVNQETITPSLPLPYPQSTSINFHHTHCLTQSAPSLQSTYSINTLLNYQTTYWSQQFSKLCSFLSTYPSAHVHFTKQNLFQWQKVERMSYRKLKIWSVFGIGSKWCASKKDSKRVAKQKDTEASWDMAAEWRDSIIHWKDNVNKR